MPICDEDKGRAEIAALGRDGKNLLSHYVRNVLACIVAVSDKGPKVVTEEVFRLEKIWKELGL